MWEKLDVFEVMKERRSIRDYTTEDVSDRDVCRLIEAALLAPSAGNEQPWEFVVVKNLETKRLLASAASGQRFIEDAPVVIVVCADSAKASKTYGGRGEKLYCLQDTAAATQNMLLVATALGLGTCWVGAFRENEVTRAIRAPKDVKPVVIVPVGHPTKKQSAPHRRPFEDVVHYEAF